MIPRYIILHCSATPDGQEFSWDAIKRYHVHNRGWTDIGYHYGVEYNAGNLVLLQGRKPWVMGAHCKAAKRNGDSLGVCVVGQFDDEPPSNEVFETAVRFLAQLCFVFRISPMNVRGHREYTDMKTCPGSKWDLTKTRSRVEGLLQFAPDIGIYMEG